MAEVRSLTERLRGSDLDRRRRPGTVNDPAGTCTGLDGPALLRVRNRRFDERHIPLHAPRSPSTAAGRYRCPAHTPAGFFVDLKVSAAAPPYLAAPPASPTASPARSPKADWWMSHRLLGTGRIFQ